MAQSSVIVRALQWLLDLDQIRLGSDAPLSLHWEMTLPIWILAPLTALALFIVVSVYRRERGGLARRVVPASVRTALILIVVLMLCQPVLQLQRNRREPSHVALVVDASRSMQLADPSRADGDPGPSRINRLRRALTAENGAALRALAERNRLELYTFGAGVTRMASADGPEHTEEMLSAIQSLQCDATTTNLPNALFDVLQRSERGRLAALVLASDGRSTEPGGLVDAIAAATARRVPIHVIPVGSGAARLDIEIPSVSAPQFAFLKDLVAVDAPVEGTGLTKLIDVNVRLTDADSGELIETLDVQLSPESPEESVRLTFKPERVGTLRLRVVAETLAGEVSADNNAAPCTVQVLDDRLSVLYVETFPRYEYRYLKNTLLREPTIRSSCLLLGADPGFAQEGSDPIRRFPETMEELSRYDVVLFGDVDPSGNWWTAAQAEMLVEFVGQRGGGFGLICGPRFAPRAYRDTPLEKLLPVRIDPSFLGTYRATLDQSFGVTTTPDGERHRLLGFARSQRDVSLFGGLYWIARTLGPKPGAEVLLRQSGAERDPDEPLPVAVIGRYGAGRVFFCGTDETWRWRRGGHEWVFDTFWLEVCRSLAIPRDVGADQRVTLRADRARYPYGQTATIQSDVSDWELLAGLGERLTTLVRDGNGAPIERVLLERLGPEAQQFEGAFLPPGAGDYTVSIEGLAMAPGTRAPSATFRVAEADVELRDPRADRDALRRLALATDGMDIGLDEIVTKAANIRDRSVQIPDDISEPLWDSKLALGVFGLLLVAEWILRKSFGMV